MPHDDPTEILPEEVFLQIFQYVLAARNTSQQKLFANKRWHRISQDEALWKNLYSHFIGDPAYIPLPAMRGVYRKQYLRILKEYQRLPDNHKLGYSIYYGYDRLLENFLEENPETDLYFKSKDGEKLIHAIHIAAAQGHVNLLDILLSHDPTVFDAKDVVGWRPLHYACKGYHTKMVEVLLSKKAQINLTDFQGVFRARVLLFDKTNFTIATEGGKKPLHIAAKEGYLEIVELFLNYISDNKEKDTSLGQILNARDNWYNTALHYACEQGHFKVVEKLIAAGARIDLVTSEGKNPLHIAAGKGYSEIVKLLLEHIVKNANNDTAVKELLNKQEESGSTVLHCACAQRDLEVVKVLIAVGADTDILTTSGETVLHIACKNNHKDIASYLPTVNPDLILARDDRHWSVMHYVCRTANFELIKFFVKEYNVSVLQAADGTITPRDLVPSGAKNRKEIIRFLEEQNREGYRKLDKVKSSRNILFVIGGLLFLFMIVFPIASPYLKVSETLAMIATLSAAGGCLLTTIGGFFWYGLSLNCIHQEIEDTQRNIEAENEPLLKNRDNENSYATFPEEISRPSRDKTASKDMEEKVLDLSDDDSSLSDQRKRKQSAQDSNPETKTSDIETEQKTKNMT